MIFFFGLVYDVQSTHKFYKEAVRDSYHLYVQVKYEKGTEITWNPQNILIFLITFT